MPITIKNENVYEASLEGKFDLIVSDPMFDDSNDLFLGLYGKLADAAKENASIFVFTDWRNSYRVQSVIHRKTGWIQHNEIIWAGTFPRKRFKNGFEKILHYVIDPKKIVSNSQVRRMADRDVAGNVWRCVMPDWSAEEPAGHRTDKTATLTDRLILSHTSEGGAVLDCFAGSGAFAWSAKMHNRDYLGFEINPEQCKAIAGRVDGIGDLIDHPCQPADYSEMEIC